MGITVIILMKDGFIQLMVVMLLLIKIKQMEVIVIHRMG